MKKPVLYIIIFCVLPLISNAQWQQVSSSFDTCAVNSIMWDGTSLFVGTGESGVFYSEDEGIVWEDRNSGLTNLNIKAIAADTGGFLYAGTKSLTMFTSGDSGNNWTGNVMIGTGTAISSVVTYGSTVLAGQVNDGVFKSTNHGASWLEVALCCASVLSLCADQEGYAYAGTVAGRVYRANGTYADWTEMDNGLPVYPVRALLSSDSLVFAGTYGGGVAVSSDKGSTWVPVNYGLSDLNVISLAKTGTKLFAGTDGGGVYISVDQGQLWLPVNEGLTYLNINALAITDNWVFAGTQNGGLWKRPLSELTGIDNRYAASRIMIYPQPASDYFFLERSGYNTATLEIFSIDGRVVLRKKIAEAKSCIDVSLLPKGLYQIRISTEQGVDCRSLVIF